MLRTTRTRPQNRPQRQGCRHVALITWLHPIGVETRDEMPEHVDETPPPVSQHASSSRAAPPAKAWDWMMSQT